MKTAATRKGDSRIILHQTRSAYSGGLPRIAREIIAMMNSAINTKNRICAIPADVPAIPPNPKAAAISAITKNVTAQPSIMLSFHCQCAQRHLPDQRGTANVGSRKPAHFCAATASGTAAPPATLHWHATTGTSPLMKGYVMAPQTIHATMVAPPDTWSDAALDAIATLHTRSVDALTGYAKMVEKAEPAFRPVADAFRSLHARHADGLARMLADHGHAPDKDGSFMGMVNRTVVSLRAMFDTIDNDVLTAVHNGETHVLDAFDAALATALPAADATQLGDMRTGLINLLNAHPAPV
jgi:hypothetical protein